MAVRTKLLAAGRRTDATPTTVYTTPDGDTAILKHLNLFNLSTTLTLVVKTTLDAGTFQSTILFEDTIPPRKWVDREVWIVIPAGNDLGIQNDGQAGVNYWFSGTELEGVAS